VVGGRDLERIARDPRPGMRRGAQPDDVRRQLGRVVVPVAGDVVKSGDDRQGSGLQQATAPWILAVPRAAAC
jgi:hypothetical protein